MLRLPKFLRMEADPNEESSDNTSSGSQDVREQTPRAKMRDLPPEKDPMGGAANTLSDPSLAVVVTSTTSQPTTP